ncbi:hypothetical protein EMN47_10975 [Prolixibacteraceae bacterium JC049]|nr:hypothetical protein [Prolixibacteraceae bacterium JC049]
MKAPVAKKVVRSTNRARTVSINAVLNNDPEEKKEVKTTINTQSQELTEPFTFDDLLEQWKKLEKMFSNQPLYLTMVAQEPQLKENFKVILPIENSIQEQLLWEIKPKIVGHLHRSLRNTKIEVEGVIMEIERKRTILTDQEKLQKMIEENPALALFKQKFQLDIGE